MYTANVYNKSAEKVCKIQNSQNMPQFCFKNILDAKLESENVKILERQFSKCKFCEQRLKPICSSDLKLHLP